LLKKTAEMDLAEKNAISHRARAFEKLREFLNQFKEEDGCGK